MVFLILFALGSAALLFFVDAALQRRLPPAIARTRRERGRQRRARLLTGVVIVLMVGALLMALLTSADENWTDAAVFAVATLALLLTLVRRLRAHRGKVGV